MKIKEIPLHEAIYPIMEAMGFTEWTEVQQKAMPLILSGRDVTILSQTGSGKTFAFLIPFIHQIWNENGRPSGMPCMVVAPTRELTTQIAGEADKLIKDKGYKAMAIYGGVDINRQIRALEGGILIGVFTPGRLMDLMDRGHIDKESIRYVVIDEADRLFDMGFIDDIRYIMRNLPRRRQTILASATMSPQVISLARDYLSNAAQVEVQPEERTAVNIEQLVYHLGSDEKKKFLVNLLQELSAQSVIIFSNTKSGVDMIEDLLTANNFKAKGISSALTQKVRNQLLSDFRREKFQILVATDVASRGLDIEGITHVINYDMPDYAENYVHRIGRTARAGRDGLAISLCSEQDYEQLHRIESFIGKKIEIGEVRDELLKNVDEPHRRARKAPPRAKPERRRPANDKRPTQRVANRKRPPGREAPATARKEPMARPRNVRRTTSPVQLREPISDDEPMVTVYKRGSYINPVEAKMELRRISEQSDHKTKTGALRSIRNLIDRFLLRKGPSERPQKGLVTTLRKQKTDQSTRSDQGKKPRTRNKVPQLPRQAAQHRPQKAVSDANSLQSAQKENARSVRRHSNRSKRTRKKKR